MAARGPDDVDGSGTPYCFWGATCGHNCTNYVAWRQWRLGIPNWQTDSRRASGWDELAVTSKAAAQGVWRDNTPSPGAIAQWNGTWGHVAIVEAVSGSSITISQDRYNTSDLTNHGPYSWATISASSPDWYIHVPGLTAASGEAGASVIHQTVVNGSAWANLSTGIDLGSYSPLAPVYMSGTWPQIFANVDGDLNRVWGDSGGWHQEDTGIDLEPGAEISAVNTGGVNAEVYTTISGVMHRITNPGSGWGIQSSGVWIGNGSLSAVNVNGTPQVMVNIGGYLHQLKPGPSSWILGNTGVYIGSSSVSAVYQGGNYPQVFVNLGGVMHQIKAGTSSWGIYSSGLNVGASTTLSAVNVGTPMARLAANTGGVHHVITAGTSAWQTQSSGVPISGARIYAVVVEGVLQVISLE